MSAALWISQALLWGVVLALGLVVLALLRQVGLLSERVAPAGALVGAETPRVGEEGPVLEVESWRGERIRIGGEAPEGADTLLFFISPRCPVCKTLLPALPRIVASESEASGRPVRLILASDGAREEHEGLVRAFGLEERPYVLSTALGLAYQVGRLPTAVLLDTKGVVRARGLVNTREHVESLFEARERGVASLQEWVQQRASEEKG